MPEQENHTIPTASLIKALREFRELFESGGKDKKLDLTGLGDL